MIETKVITDYLKGSTEKFDKYYNKAKTLLEQALSIQKPYYQIQNLINMATQNFNLELALKTIPEFTGNYKDLNSFLAIVELINNGLAENQKIILLNFVYNVKLNSTVRTSLGVSAPTTIERLKNILSNRYKTSRTVAQIQATLSTFSQKV